jgi:hypothetical protein
MNEKVTTERKIEIAALLISVAALVIAIIA